MLQYQQVYSVYRHCNELVRKNWSEQNYFQIHEMRK